MTKKIKKIIMQNKNLSGLRKHISNLDSDDL